MFQLKFKSSWVVVFAFLFIPFFKVYSATPPVLHNISDLLSSEALKTIDDVGSNIPDIIFDAIHDIDVAVPIHDRFNLSLGIRRNVYDNQNLYSKVGTWTVVDRMRIMGSIPILDSLVNAAADVTKLGFFIGTKTGIDFINIRQVRPPEYDQIESEEQRKSEIENDQRYSDLKAHAELSSDSGTQPRRNWIQTVSDTGKRIVNFIPADSENFARYSKLWNFGFIPFRLPLRAESIKTMQDGEIYSYVGEGAIQLGASISANLDPTGLSNLISAGMSVSAFVKGTYRISIMRVNDHIARVKVTRETDMGYGFNAGNTFKPNLLGSILIVNQINQLFKVFPFSISLGRDHDVAIETGFEYDLNNTNAREAFEKAVLGDFKLSDDLSIKILSDKDSLSKTQLKWRKNLDETGVIRNFARHTTTDNSTYKNRLQFTFLIHQDVVSSTQDVIIEVTTPEGTRRILKSIARNSREAVAFWKWYNKYEHNFQVSLDLDALEHNPSQVTSFPLLEEGRIQDSTTTQRNLYSYIQETEENVGKPLLFPRTPELEYENDSWADGFLPNEYIHNLGPSRFYYQVQLTPDQVQKFIDTPEVKMWSYLEEAFRVNPGTWSTRTQRMKYYISRGAVSLLDVFLHCFNINIKMGTDLIHADRFHSQWLKLRKITDVRKRAEAFAAMFADTYYSRELSRLIRIALEKEEVVYRAEGCNQVIGNIVSTGGTTLCIPNIPADLESDMNFDHESRRVLINDPKLIVDQFNAIPLGDNKIRLDFTLKTVPKKLYFDLMIKNWTIHRIFKNKVVSAVILDNHGEFHEGANSINIDVNDKNHPLHTLFQDIQPRMKYLIRMSVSDEPNTVRWGKASQSFFQIRNAQSDALEDADESSEELLGMEIEEAPAAQVMK